MSVLQIALCLACVPLLFAPVVGWLVLRRERRHPEEAGRRPRYQERCGGRLGRARRPLPFLRVAVYDHGVVLAGPGVHFLPAAAIEGVVLDGERAPRTLRLHLRDAALPAPVELWPVDGDRLAEALRELAP
ncbi:MAG: hypothetical protein D6739_00875 [Nitrospirae bacterium]|nr:MAG: hypothetical protein D6739_00875 [Nitrospirota bacterium]